MIKNKSIKNIMIDLLKVKFNMNYMNNSYLNINMNTEYLIVLHNIQNINLEET